ncbi:MAG: hypothetical protein ACJAVT_002706 [Yoonia sp.]|jgi:uncharacterized protein (DUF427 family)
MSTAQSRHDAGQIWVRRLHRRITLYYENLVVADSKGAFCTVEIDPDLREPVLYLPTSDVIADLTPNGLRETCDLKGDATYFDLLDVDGTIIAKNAAWSFANPTPRAAQIRNCIAFTNRYFTFEDLPL